MVSIGHRQRIEGLPTMIDRSATAQALAKAIAYKQPAKTARPPNGARRLVELLECADILGAGDRVMTKKTALSPNPVCRVCGRTVQRDPVTAEADIAILWTQCPDWPGDKIGRLACFDCNPVRAAEIRADRAERAAAGCGPLLRLRLTRNHNRRDYPPDVTNAFRICLLGHGPLQSGQGDRAARLARAAGGMSAHGALLGSQVSRVSACWGVRGMSEQQTAYLPTPCPIRPHLWVAADRDGPGRGMGRNAPGALPRMSHRPKWLRCYRRTACAIHTAPC